MVRKTRTVRSDIDKTYSHMSSRFRLYRFRFQAPAQLIPQINSNSRRFVTVLQYQIFWAFMRILKSIFCSKFLFIIFPFILNYCQFYYTQHCYKLLKSYSNRIIFEKFQIHASKLQFMVFKISTII